MTLPALLDTTTTRETLHRLAEDVLAAEQSAAAGTIRLAVTPDGFGTGWFAGPDGDQRLRVEGAHVVRETDHSATREPIAAPFDLAAARVLYAWWALGDAALRSIAPAEGETVSPVVLWPEHFDVAVTLTTADGAVNIGFSPGDEFSAEPYLYAGPWEARVGEFWNAPFGAIRRYSEVAAADHPAAYVAAFVTAARAALHADPRSTESGAQS